MTAYVENWARLESWARDTGARIACEQIRTHTQQLTQQTSHFVSRPVLSHTVQHSSTDCGTSDLTGPGHELTHIRDAAQRSSSDRRR